MYGNLLHIKNSRFENINIKSGEEDVNSFVTASGLELT